MPAGTTTETFTATDTTGNTATCAFRIEVVPNMPGIPVPLLDTIGVLGLGLGLAFAAAFGLRRKQRK